MATYPRTHRLTHSHTNKPPTAGVQLVSHTSIIVSQTIHHCVPFRISDNRLCNPAYIHTCIFKSTELVRMHIIQNSLSQRTLHLIMQLEILNRLVPVVISNGLRAAPARRYTKSNPPPQPLLHVHCMHIHIFNKVVVA